MIILQLDSEQLSGIIQKAVKNVLDNQDSVDKRHFKSNRNLMTTHEAARFLNLSVPTIYGKTSTNEIPHFKKGKRLYFDRKKLEQWITEGKVETKTEIQEDIDSFLADKSK